MKHLSERDIAEVIEKINKKLAENSVTAVAVDGRCGAGKTTLADKLSETFECDTIHMDDFFLPKNMKSAERLAESGGNVHYERVYDEVVSKLKTGKAFSYRPYSCKTDSYGESIKVEPKSIIIVEGSYACHPKLRNYYDLHIFVDILPEEQTDRIIRRNGSENAKIFENVWIPLEEKYFKEYSVKENCEIVVENV